MSQLSVSVALGASFEPANSIEARKPFIKWMRAMRRGASFTALLTTLAAMGISAHAATFFKANNTDALDQTTSYVISDGAGGFTPATVLPGNADTILFDNKVTSSLTVSAGAAPPAVGTIQVADPAGPVTINLNGTMLIGSSTAGGTAVELNGATQDLTIAGTGNFRFPKVTTTRAFNVPAGRTLTVNPTISTAGNTQNLALQGGGNIILTGPITSNPFNIMITGGTVATLSGNNTYTGVTGTSVTSGTLNAVGASPLGTGPVLLNPTTPATATVNFSGAAPTIASLASSGTAASAVINLGSTLTLNGTVNTTYTGVIKDGATPGSISKVGTATQTLNGQNTYSGGTSITAGSVSVGNSSIGLGSGVVTLNNASVTVGLGSTATTLANPLLVQGTTSTLFTGGSANESVSGAISGSAPLAIGIGTLSFNGGPAQFTNYTGAVTFGGSAGTLRLQGLTPTNAATNAGGTLFDIGAATATLFTRDSALIRLGDLSATGTGTKLLGASNDSGATTYEIGGRGGTTTFAGVIGNGNAATPGLTAITKVGAGALTLANSNTYTGTTTVNAGTLTLGAADRIADASGLTLGGGTFNTAGFGETLNALNLTNSTNSNLDLGNGTSVVNFSGLGAGTGAVNILNYSSGDRVFIGTNAALSSTQLAQITFVNANGTSGNTPAQQLSTGEITPGAAGPPAATTGAIISEFRFHGATGPTDEYVELRNKTTGPLDISGWSIQTRSAAGLQTTLVPSNTIIPLFGHFLFTGAGYSLSGYGTSNASIAGDVLDSSGVALFNAAGAVQDAVGFAASDATLREGAGLPSYPTSNGEYALMRDFVISQEKDTSDSSNDFVLVSTSGAGVAGESAPGSATTVAAQLGAPSPEGLSSPNYFNNQTLTTLLDPGVASNVSPNRVRLTGGGTLGTLIVRRTLKNTSSVPITRLRLSVVSITSLNSAGYAGGAQADVRLVSAPAETGVLLSNGTTSVNVEGTTLESGTNQPQQGLGGGLGSSLDNGTVTLSTPLAPGASRNFAFRVQIERGGNYFITLNILAITQ